MCVVLGFGIWGSTRHGVLGFRVWGVNDLVGLGVPWGVGRRRRGLSGLGGLDVGF